MAIRFRDMAGPPRNGHSLVVQVLLALIWLAAVCGCSKKPQGRAQGESAQGGSLAAATGQQQDAAAPDEGDRSPAEAPDGAPEGPAAAPEYEVVDPLPEDPVLDMLLEAMEGDDPAMRSVAVDTAMSIPGEEVTLWCVGHMRTAGPAARAAILEVLARRDDPVGLPTALEALKESDEAARLAGIRAAAALGGEMVVGPLVRFLASEDAAERTAAREALVGMPGDLASGAMARSLEGARAAARRELLGILSERRATGHVDVAFASARDDDGSVRLAALKALGALADADSLTALLELLLKAEGSRELRAAEKAVTSVCARTLDKEACAGPVLAALEGAARSPSGVKARCSLVRALGRLGAASGLPVVRAALEDGESEVQEAAVRALADWPDAAASPFLIEIARSSTKETHRVIALRGYVRIAGLPSDRPAEDALAMYREALGLAAAWGRPQENKLVLASLAEMAHMGALRMAAGFLDDEALKAEAAAAVVKIAVAVTEAAPNEAHLDDALRAEVASALEKVLATVKDEPLRGQAEEALGSVRKEQE